MRTTNLQSEYEKQLVADKKVLRDGISPKAVEVLRRRYGYDLPLFGAESMSSDGNNERFFRLAMIKEGQRQVLSFIFSCTK